MMGAVSLSCMCRLCLHTLLFATQIMTAVWPDWDGTMRLKACWRNLFSRVGKVPTRVAKMLCMVRPYGNSKGSLRLNLGSRSS